MKTRDIGSRPRPDARHAAPRAARADRTPPVAARTHVEGEPTMCDRCGAVYERKTWRAGERSRRTSLVGVRWTTCPACEQIEDQEYFGRVRVAAELAPRAELEVRRRIWNVEGRARHTQPERRTVFMGSAGRGLEVLTTSQKLAHRIARELVKAFGGAAEFSWNERDGSLETTWIPPGALRRAPGPASPESGT